MLAGSHGPLRLAQQPAQARPRASRSAAAATAAGPPAAQPQRAVVILPGLGNNAKDYTALSSQLASRQLHVEVASVTRLDWARNAAGLTDINYWRGTLKPRPTVDWYLDRVSAAVEAAKRATDGAPITLLAHSAGGWLGRVFLLDSGAASNGIDQFVSLGSPHLPPPPGVIDQTRGILTWVQQACPGAYEPGVRYVTVAGRFIQGSELTGKEGTWQQRVVGAGYQQVCGDAAVWGDGVVPVPVAHLEGAEQLTLDGVYHSPLGASDGPQALAGLLSSGGSTDSGSSDSEAGSVDSSGEWSGSARGAPPPGAEGSAGPVGAEGASGLIPGDALVAELEAAQSGPHLGPPGQRLWYGSAGVLERWVGRLLEPAPAVIDV